MDKSYCFKKKYLFVMRNFIINKKLTNFKKNFQN